MRAGIVQQAEHGNDFIHTYGEGRKCKHPLCCTILSIYREGEYCAIHSYYGAKKQDEINIQKYLKKKNKQSNKYKNNWELLKKHNPKKYKQIMKKRRERVASGINVLPSYNKEDFCQFYGKGMSIEESFSLAYKNNDIKKLNEILNQQSVQRRMKYLREKYEKK